MKRKARETLLAYLFLLPSFLVLGTFVFWPVGFSFVLSFFRWDFKNMRNPVFAGFENYAEIFRFQSLPSHSFAYSLIETLTVIAVCFAVVLSLYAFTKRPYLSTITVMVSAMCFWFATNYKISTILVVVLLALIYALLRNKAVFSKHGIGISLITLLLIALWIFFDKRIYTVVNFFLESRDKNLFIKAIYNTLYYVVLSVPTTIGLALIIALLLNSNIKLRAFFRTAYFVPFVTSVVAISLVWRWIFDDAYGLLNYLLSFFKISKIAWLKDERWTIPTIAIVSIWKTVGYDAVILLAGLQNIDKSYYEAAEVDGAKAWDKFLYITWPLLTPTTFFLLVVSLISSFKVFTEVYVLYSGLPGPYNNSGMTMVYYVFDRFYVQQRMGIACAAAYILFAIILIFTALQFWLSRRTVEYIS
ncbi:MAG TPA: sugar ABC transporter permease [Pseudothermotoga sp.]|nr:sugar ABC transporter permease [Pseudothermotoga sp.]HOK83624.1 sugar ABC transporter permease [Pseudothermotoga sp.]HPP69263.1 sugar ABC transporter permease [Pseudothermotoga sp.]